MNKIVSRVGAAICALLFVFTVVDIVNVFSAKIYKMGALVCRLPWYLTYVGENALSGDAVTGVLFIVFGVLMLILMLFAALVMAMPPLKCIKKLYIPAVGGALFVFGADFIYNAYQIISQISEGYSLRYFSMYHAPYIFFDIVILTALIWCLKAAVTASKE